MHRFNQKQLVLDKRGLNQTDLCTLLVFPITKENYTHYKCQCLKSKENTFAVCLTEDLRLTANPVVCNLNFKVIKYSSWNWSMDLDKC